MTPNPPQKRHVDPSELPPNERPDFVPEGEQGPAEPMDLSTNTATVEEEQRKQVEARVVLWREAMDGVLTAQDPETLIAACERLEIVVSPDEAARVLAQPPHERIGILLRVPELDEQDRKFLAENKGIPEAAFRLQKGFLQRVTKESFEVGPDGARLSRRERAEVNARIRFIAEMRAGLERGDFGVLKPKERERVNAMLGDSLGVEDYIVALSAHPEGQQAVYDALGTGGGLTTQQLIGKMVEVELKYALGPKAQEDRTRQQVATQEREASEEERTEVVLSELGLENDPNVQVVRVNRWGVVIRLDEGTTCVVRRTPQGVVLNATKVDINGHEFVSRQPIAVNTPGAFRKEVGLAHARAVMAAYRLPFEGPEMDRAIEVFARADGEVAEFTYDQWTPAFESRFIAFLEAVTPDREEGRTRQSFTALGMIGDEGSLKQDRYEAIVRDWVTARAVEKPEEFLAKVKDRYAPPKEAR